jgi:hypothetical protein
MAGGAQTIGHGSRPMMVGVRCVERARIVSSSHGVNLIDQEERT